MPAESAGLRPPPLFDEDGNPRGEAGAVTFAAPTRNVSRAFEIARAEITNRQYLKFLRTVSPEKTAAQMEQLVPSAWKRPNPWKWEKEDPEQQTEAWEDTVYLGPYGSPWKIPRVYEAGRENHPVEGVLLAQAQAYAAWLSNRLSKRCRLPTVGEFLRAGRGSGRDPYPWGADASNPKLICARAFDEAGRTVSLLGRHGDEPLVGLVGNLPEYVWDPDWQDPDPGNGTTGRWLLAGGCYRFPPELCTLDSFLDAAWEYVEFDVSGSDEILNPLTFYAGFRLVREAGLF